MRLSRLLFRTLKEAPVDADVISHQLLERGGFLKKLGKGLYIYTPLMWKVIGKINHIIREELNRAGCQEVSLPLLHPAEIWKQTGRFEDFTSAKLMYTLKDREDHEFCLGPTHEEIIVSLVANWVTSHKQLPLNLYQIGTKFRDEIRPRFGLMRGKEFLMKDGYSFSTSPEGMDEQYNLMREAYSRIFERLGLDFVIVQAHGGKIGKGKSEEFQVKADIGEDAVMVCEDYAANVEATVSLPKQFTYDTQQKPKQRVSTPGIKTIQDLADFFKTSPERILKTVIYKLTYHNREEFVAIGIRGDRQVNDVKVCTHLGAMEIALASDEEILKLTQCPPGFAGPIQLNLPFLADHTAAPMTNFICGANQVDAHEINVNWTRDCNLPEFADFLLAEPGDGCPFVPGGVYKTQRGIEVGHIFNLGVRYTEALGAFFQDENGQTRPIWMGTYGIGVGRAAAACVEQRHDEKGILWPLAIAPFQVTITAVATHKPEQKHGAEEIYKRLIERGYDPLLDDREERLGFKLKDSDLIGIPFKIIIGKGFEEDGRLEIESRTGEKITLPQEQLENWAEENLKTDLVLDRIH